MPNKEAAEGGEAKKKGFPLLLIIGVAVVLLGGGGFFAYQKFFAAKSSGAAVHADSEQKVIFDWEPFLVNLADAGGKRYLKLCMKLELNNTHVLEEAKNRSFEMKDSVLMLLSGKEFEDISTPAGKVALKQEIMSQINRVIKLGQVRDIYFTEFIVQ